MNPIRISTLAVMILLSFNLQAQNKYSYVNFNSITEVKGTDYFLASIENHGKTEVQEQFLLFVNSRSGESNEVRFPPKSLVREVVQIKIDTLGINQFIVVGSTVDLDKKNSIDYNDPRQVFVVSADGKVRTQLTEDNFFTQLWKVHSRTGSLMITGYFDSNNNGKYDKEDKNQILVFDLKTLSVIQKI